MVREFEVTLSSGEIYVLAALMNYNYVFGIESKTLHKWDSNISKESKKVVKLLEKKKFVQCDLDGTVYIDQHIQRIINCICDADIVSTFTGNLYDGKNTTVYILGKDMVSSIVKANSNGEYNISLGINFNCRDVLNEAKSSDFELHERILFEEASHIQQKIVSFQQDEAERLLSKTVTNGDSVAKLTKLLSGNCKYIDVQVHKKSSSLYNNIYSCVLLSDDDNIYKMQLDNNEVLFIDSVDFSSICENLDRVLSRGIDQ